LFYNTKLNGFDHNLLFNFTIIIISFIYELHHPPIGGVSENRPNQQHYQSCRGTSLNPTSCFHPVKKFQEQFDVPLTEIIRRRLYITDFGKEIAVAAENILDELNAINNRMLSYKKQLTGRLKISVVSTGKYIIPYFLSDFYKTIPVYNCNWM
jgi:hypothetical protein